MVVETMVSLAETIAVQQLSGCSSYLAAVATETCLAETVTVAVAAAS